MTCHIKSENHPLRIRVSAVLAQTAVGAKTSHGMSNRQQRYSSLKVANQEYDKLLDTCDMLQNQVNSYRKQNGQHMGTIKALKSSQNVTQTILDEAEADNRYQSKTIKILKDKLKDLQEAYDDVMEQVNHRVVKCDKSTQSSAPKVKCQSSQELRLDSLSYILELYLSKVSSLFYLEVRPLTSK